MWGCEQTGCGVQGSKAVPREHSVLRFWELELLPCEAGTQFQGKGDAGITLEFTCPRWNSLLYAVPHAGDTLALRVQLLQPRAQGTLVCATAASALCAAASKGHWLQKSCWQLAERNGGFQCSSFSLKGKGCVSSTVCFHGSQPSSLRWSFCRSWKFPRGYGGMLDITFSHFHLQF